jgi:3-deoxy-7-phosphoheptulonate synthase
MSLALLVSSWSPSSWRIKPVKQIPKYENEFRLKKVTNSLKSLPPLIYSGECRNLMEELAEAGDGKRFVLTAGDCAESFRDFDVQGIMNQYRIILQMTLILMHGIQKPVVKIGRIAGQFAKPRSNLYESVGNVTLNSYQGDIINSVGFTKKDRTPNPFNMIRAYHQSCQTLNLLRALSNGGYADISRIHDWNLEFVKRYDVNLKYKNLADSVQDSLKFLDSLRLQNVDVLKQAKFYTGHEALLLPYEEALTRLDSTTNKYYGCSGHYLWVGERTRDLDGAHIEYIRGINNPVGIKVSANVNITELVDIIKVVNPTNKKGKVSIITRMGGVISKVLPSLIKEVQKNNLNVVWISDPMHANTKQTQKGIKTRFLTDIKREIVETFEIHKQMNTTLAGVHLELTGNDVTECVGSDILNMEKTTFDNYRSLCDPRLNAAQSLELAFWLSDLYKL